MKKLTIINSIIIIMMISLSSIQPLNAAIFTDINGTYIDLGKEKSVYGGGLTFLWDMPDFFDSKNVLFYINSTFAYSNENKNEPAETVRTYVPTSAGFELRFQILQIPLYITGSAGAGVSYFKKEGPAYYGPYMDPSKTLIDTAFGPYADVMLGLNYVMSQHTAFFVKSGYQRSFYDEENIETPAGFQFATGVRIAITESYTNFGGIGDEYEDSETANYQIKKTNSRPKKVTITGFTPGVIIPLGNFRDMAKTGYGGMINFTRRNLFIKRFEAGIDTGFYYASGKDLIDEGKPNYDRFLIVPLLAHTGYKVWFKNGFSFIPTVSLGAAYFNSKYMNFDKATLKKTDVNDNFIDPMVKIGIGVEYLVTEPFSISMTGGYGMFIEKDGPMSFATAGIGLNYKFQIRP